MNEGPSLFSKVSVFVDREAELKAISEAIEKLNGACAQLTVIIDYSGPQSYSLGARVYGIGHQLLGRGARLKTTLTSYFDIIYDNSDHYCDSFYNFKLAIQIDNRDYFENHLPQIFEQLGIQYTKPISFESSNTAAFNGFSQSLFLNDCCFKLLNESIQALYRLLLLKKSDSALLSKLVEQVVEYILAVNYFIAFLRRSKAEVIRFQFLSLLIHNRLSRSPTPQKKEPPVGGVKIGGEQHEFLRHVAGTLYPKQTTELAA